MLSRSTSGSSNPSSYATSNSATSHHGNSYLYSDPPRVNIASSNPNSSNAHILNGSPVSPEDSNAPPEDNLPSSGAVNDIHGLPQTILASEPGSEEYSGSIVSSRRLGNGNTEVRIRPTQGGADVVLNRAVNRETSRTLCAMTPGTAVRFYFHQRGSGRWVVGDIYL